MKRHIGYARVSTADQDLTAQRVLLAAIGVEPGDIYVDHGLTGTNRDRPGLAQALAAVRAGDQLVVTKLDRLARSIPDARDIVDEFTAKGVALNIGRSVQDPAQRRQLLRLADEGEHTQAELGEVFGVSRGTVQRELSRR